MNNTKKLIMPTELNEVTPYVIRAVPTKTALFRKVALSIQEELYQHFGGTFCPQHLT
jgi:hypothetical protein